MQNALASPLSLFLFTEDGSAMFLRSIGELKYSHPETKLVNKDEALSLRGLSYFVLHMLLCYHKGPLQYP
jgi:hypothetical protein